MLTHKLCSVLSGLPCVLQVFVLAPQQAASTLKTGCVFHALVYIYILTAGRKKKPTHQQIVNPHPILRKPNLGLCLLVSPSSTELPSINMRTESRERLAKDENPDRTESRELASLGGLGAHETLPRATDWARQQAPLLDKWCQIPEHS